MRRALPVGAAALVALLCQMVFPARREAAPGCDRDQRTAGRGGWPTAPETGAARVRTLVLSEPTAVEVSETGGKGASLARLSALGLPVPPGFVVRCGALEQALGERAAHLRDAIRDAGDDALLARCAARAGEIVSATEFPRRLELDIRARYSELGDALPWPCAPGVSEDGEAASYAGQQETYLNVRRSPLSIERTEDCWESYFSERASVLPRAPGLVGGPRDGRRGPAPSRRRSGGRDVHDRSDQPAQGPDSDRGGSRAR